MSTSLTRLTRTLTCCGIAVLCLALGGCGLKGDLYLPDTPAPAPEIMEDEADEADT